MLQDSTSVVFEGEPPIAAPLRPVRATGHGRFIDGSRPFRRQRRAEERIRCLGVTLDFVKPPEVLLYLRRAVAARRSVVIANHNAHSLHLVRRDPELMRFFEAADLVQVDSMPVILWSLLLGRRSRRFHRSTYLDWRDDFWRLAQGEGWRVFYLGHAPGVAERAATRIRAEFPGVTLQVRDGFFDATPGSPENAAVVAEIEAFRPGVLLVGMGMPRQELWIHRNRSALPPCAMLPVGAAFDYEAGVQVQAPRWMGRLGIEWAFRLVSDPRRMAMRYLVEPWSLVGPLAADLLHRATEALSHREPAPDLAAAIARRGEWRERS